MEKIGKVPRELQELEKEVKGLKEELRSLRNRENLRNIGEVEVYPLDLTFAGKDPIGLGLYEDKIFEGTREFKLAITGKFKEYSEEVISCLKEGKLVLIKGPRA
jgi:hypothetical protein